MKIEYSEATQVGFDLPLPLLLCALRERNGISATTLARRAQLSRTTLYRWESGQSLPRIQELETVLDVLSVSAAERLHCLAAIPAPRGIRRLKSDTDAPLLPVGVGEMLHALRLRAGHSQEDAAVATQVTQGMVSQWERAVSIPDERSVRLLCGIFHATQEETALLVARAGEIAPSLPQNYDALNQAIRDLIAFEPTPHLDLPFLSLASRYYSLWKENKIDYDDAAGVWGYYADFLAWRHGRYEDAIRLANVALKSIESRQRRFLTGGHFFAFMALFSAYNLGGQPQKSVDLLDHFEGSFAPGSEVTMQFFRGEALCRSGQCEQGFVHMRDAIRRAQKETQFAVWSQIYAEHLCQQGRYGDALEAMVPSAKSETRPSVLHGHAMTMTWALAGSGEIAEADRLYRETRPQMDEIMSPLMRAIVEPAEALLDANS